MKRDFTVRKYGELLDAFTEAGYNFQRVEDFIQKPNAQVVVLRHDVDLRNWAAIRLAKYEASKGIKSKYYFRKSKSSNSRGLSKVEFFIRETRNYIY